jgi:hypothetical protein
MIAGVRSGMRRPPNTTERLTHEAALAWASLTVSFGIDTHSTPHEIQWN